MTEPKRKARRPNVVLFVLLGVVVLGLVAVVAGLGVGDDDDDDGSAPTSATETRDVEVIGEVLPTLANATNDPAVGTPAPVLEGEDVDGDAVAIGDDRPALVVFIAHWCSHCQREVPVLVSYFDEQGVPDDVDVFGVATGIDPDAPNYPPSAWLEEEAWTFPTLYDDGDQSAAMAYGLSAYPYFVAIDADGNVAARGSGELGAAEVEALLEAARG